MNLEDVVIGKTYVWMTPPYPNKNSRPPYYRATSLDVKAVSKGKSRVRVQFTYDSVAYYRYVSPDNLLDMEDYAFPDARSDSSWQRAEEKI